jgi:DNA-binding PadR family transcriptional regulator
MRQNNQFMNSVKCEKLMKSGSHPDGYLETPIDLQPEKVQGYSPVVGSLFERLIRNQLDIIIMARLKDQEASGYELTTYLHKRFDFYCISPGTVYSTLYSMERKGLISALENEKIRIYHLTLKGKEFLDEICNSSGLIIEFFSSLVNQESTNIIKN